MYVNDAGEGMAASVKEAAVEYLQEKCDVLQVEDRTGETHTEEETLQGGQEEGERGHMEVGLPHGLS